MLGKGKDPSTSVSTRIRASASQMSTAIGKDINITGEIKGKEDLEIQGTISGSIELPANQLTVGSKGKVEAEINAKSVIISGQLSGNIMAGGKVLITSEADFKGEIKAKSIAVEEGAYLNAVIKLERNDEADRTKPKEPLASAASVGNISKA